MEPSMKSKRLARLFSPFASGAHTPSATPTLSTKQNTTVPQPETQSNRSILSRSSKHSQEDMDTHSHTSSLRRSLPLIRDRRQPSLGSHHNRWTDLATKCISGAGADGNGEFVTANQERLFNDRSFYDPKQYDVALKRCDDGLELTNALLKMISERADIEQRHSEALQSWSWKWRNYLDKSCEYGTTKATWYSLACGAEQDVEIHKNIRYRLHNDLIAKIDQYKKEKYPKNLHRIKKTKDLEREFESAQKPWLKQLHKVECAKREYFITAKRTKQAEVVERTVHSDVGSTEDQKKRISEKVDILRKELSFAHERYRQSVNEASQLRERYVQNIDDVFMKCQQFEKTRLDFFKEMFQVYTNALMGSPNEDYKKSAKLGSEAVKLHNTGKDLEWWAATYATGTLQMAKWPVFEEYNESSAPTFRRMQHCASVNPQPPHVRLDSLHDNNSSNISAVRTSSRMGKLDADRNFALLSSFCKSTANASCAVSNYHVHGWHYSHREDVASWGSDAVDGLVDDANLLPISIRAYSRSPNSSRRSRENEKADQDEPKKDYLATTAQHKSGGDLAHIMSGNGKKESDTIPELKTSKRRSRKKKSH
ncbi:hypothetical protein ACOME3_004335 [Neoechinorhynchus agilis]